MDRNVIDHKIDTIIDSFELYVEDNSVDDLQPVVTARKRKNRENTPQSGSQKRLKGKGKATNSEVTTTSSTGISTTDETIMFNKTTLDVYDLEYSSDDFDAPVVKRFFLGESTRSAFRITKPTSAAVESSTAASKTSLSSPKSSKSVPTVFNSAATSVKSSFCPVVRSLKAKFGQDAVLVFEDWSAPNVKYQEPTRSKGLIRMLKKNGFVVYLINEYKTSSHCPTYENVLEKFKTVPNPRLYQRKKKPDVLCNGLLRNKKKTLESRSSSRIEFSQDPK
ncbi:hypothetical protein G6F57_015275 [Rhizopus arrhizus]|uniref:Uncharacterized protein n=1 Tax=Rhizopus oryzae TaxID=64495 RepID=A0A9P6WXT8_RHIOR|nr:hypothetical protein G6F23_009011 [Rhizopus arrhizus]KAG0752902.1 hypothetical protein G6F24_013306 [Rhizopus arrhizus]KAG0774381.1 hypothetical protein G6F22_014108 [Rhizopus arrhizus]KAG0778912.1 hypothetical protein G6F21_012796 [Rhizopus arrhizus]KAG0804254.1 hypothetical protein G6F20_012847 [Rhizopus arrhizus]